MKKFSFRLQTVLDMREKKLEDKRREMAVAIAELNRQIEFKENMLARTKSTEQALEDIYNSGNEIDIVEITNYKDFLGNMIVATKAQEYVIQQAKNKLRFKQLEVSEALKDLKVLEKLKETQETKFYKHYEYVQAKEIDDIASTRYCRSH